MYSHNYVTKLTHNLSSTVNRVQGDWKNGFPLPRKISKFSSKKCRVSCIFLAKKLLVVRNWDGVRGL